jgi:hypothetical protein
MTYLSQLVNLLEWYSGFFVAEGGYLHAISEISSSFLENEFGCLMAYK